MGRVRLRKIDFDGGENDDYELLVPSGKVYGAAPSGTVDILRDWAKAIQSDKLDVIRADFDKFPNYAKYPNLSLRGGSYSDSFDGASDILGALIGRDMHGTIPHYKDDEKEENGQEDERMQERMDQSIRDHDFQNIHVSGDYDDYGDGQMYMRYDVYIYFSFPASSFISIPNRVDNDLRDKIRKAIDFYSLNECNIDQEGDNVELKCDFYDEENDNTFNNFEHYMDLAKSDLDNKYENIKTAIMKVFIAGGYMNHPFENIPFKHLVKDVDEDNDF